VAKPSWFRPLGDTEIRRSLVEDLVPVADDLRQLYTDFGGRPYRVFLVWVGWSADADGDGVIRGRELRLEDGERGVGRPSLLREEELLPTPSVVGLSALSDTSSALGSEEEGTVQVDQVSLSYSEEVLRGLLPEYRDPDHPQSLRDGVSFFWEIVEARPAGRGAPLTAGGRHSVDLAPARRRFVLAGSPERAQFGFCWRPITLERAEGARARDGEVEDLG